MASDGSGWHVHQRPVSQSSECRPWHSQMPVKVLCPYCNDIIIFSGRPLRYDGKMMRWPTAVLVVSYLVALILVRHQGALWPAYIFVALSVIHLFALVFSKGAVLEYVAATTLLVVLGWALLWLFPLKRTVGSAAWHLGPIALKPAVGGTVWHWGPIVLWAAAILYGIMLGASVPQKAYRSFSTQFLTMAAFVFGMWAVSVVNVQYGFGYTWLPQVAVPAAAIAPLVVIVVDVLRNRRDTVLASTASALLVAISAYLTVMQMVGAAWIRAQKELPWKILSLPAGHNAEPAWFALLRWKTAISAVVFVGVLGVIVASSIRSVAQEESPASGLTALRTAIEISDGKRRRSSSDGDLVIAEHIRGAVLRTILVIIVSTDFTVKVVRHIVMALAQAVPRVLAAIFAAVRQFALPFACFSISGLLIMVVVRTIAGYGAGSSYGYAPFALWGGLICAAALVLVLCVGAFALTRVASNSDVSFYAAASAVPAALTACIFWILITAFGLVLWPLDYGLSHVGIHAVALGIGSLQLANLCFVLGCLIVLMNIVLFSGGFRQTLREIDDEPNYGFIITGFVWVIFSAAALAVLLGHGLIAHWLGTMA